MTIIDVWDPTTFDDELTTFLAGEASTVRNYRGESRRLSAERKAQGHRGPPTENRFGPAFSALQKSVTAMMHSRVIRAWHFTRLADHEISAIRERGMQPMTLALIAQRLDLAVAARLIDRQLADDLYAASPYHRQVAGNREDKIWLSAQPYPLDDSGVEELLDRWGGESLSFVHREGATLARLQTLGTACVIEVALPMELTTRVSAAATNVVDAFAQSIGIDGGWGGGADIVMTAPIRPDWIMGMHREGDASYAAMGRGYPANFHAPPD